MEIRKINMERDMECMIVMNKEPVEQLSEARDESQIEAIIIVNI